MSHPDTFSCRQTLKRTPELDKIKNDVETMKANLSNEKALLTDDLIAERLTAPYDYLPLVKIIEGAGGIITDWEGNKLIDGDSSRCRQAGLIQYLLTNFFGNKCGRRIPFFVDGNI